MRALLKAEQEIQCVNEVLSRKIGGSDEHWSEAIAVGDFTLVHKVRNELGYKAAHREVIERGGTMSSGSRLKVIGPNLALK